MVDRGALSDFICSVGLGERRKKEGKKKNYLQNTVQVSSAYRNTTYKIILVLIQSISLLITFTQIVVQIRASG